MDDILTQLFGSHAVTISIWMLLSGLLFAFAAGVRMTWLILKESKLLSKRMDVNDKTDKAQQQAIEELSRAVAALKDENKSLEGRVSAASSLLTSVTAQRVL